MKRLSICMLALGWFLLLVSPVMAQQSLFETVTNVSIPAYRQAGTPPIPIDRDGALSGHVISTWHRSS